MLVAAGCVEAEIEVVSGSDFVRNDILNMEVSDEHFLAAFTRLRQRDIRTRAVVLVGSPYATEMSSKSLVQLVEGLEPDECEVKVYHPLPGTRGRDLCREAGWLSNRGEDNFTLQRSILDMPNLPARTIDRTVRRLRRGSNGSWWTAFGRLRLPDKQSVRKLLSNLLPFQNR
jgi:hypothetical protein